MINHVARAKAWEAPKEYIGQLPTSGRGVGVVVMDEGFDLTHPDLKGRVIGVQTSPQDRFDSDPMGHGTHTLGIIGGSGASSDGQVQGVAPNAKLIAMKVHLAQGEGLPDSIASIERGIQWAVTNKEAHNIRVINCSFVLPTLEVPDPKNPGVFLPHDPLSYALSLAREAGILVVAGAGNFADKSPIATPAGDPSVIAVGALDTKGTPDDLSDDSVAKFSSRGLSIHGQNKPDILAPGVGIMAPSALGSDPQLANERNRPLAQVVASGPIEEVQKMAKGLAAEGKLPAIALQLPEPSLRKIMGKVYDVSPTLGENSGQAAYIAHDGTSEAAPIVTGLLANMFEANPNLTADQAKEILYSTARPVSGDSTAVGRGAIDAQAAIAKATHFKS